MRRTCAWLPDRVDLTPESVAALTRALDGGHPEVRRKAVHALGCENCKPNGCAVDVQPLFERAIGDDSVLVRSMVIHVVAATTSLCCRSPALRRRGYDAGRSSAG